MLAFLLPLAAFALCASAGVPCPSPLPGNVYQYSASLLDGTSVPFSKYNGYVLLIVNVGACNQSACVLCMVMCACAGLLCSPAPLCVRASTWAVCAQRVAPRGAVLMLVICMYDIFAWYASALPAFCAALWCVSSSEPSNNPAATPPVRACAPLPNCVSSFLSQRHSTSTPPSNVRSFPTVCFNLPPYLPPSSLPTVSTYLNIACIHSNLAACWSGDSRAVPRVFVIRLRSWSRLS